MSANAITSFQGSAVSADELNRIMADSLALERARVFRRLLVTRCGALAAASAVVGLWLRWLPPFASWFSVTLFLGLTLLAHAYGVLPRGDETVVSQLARAIFGGRGPAY